MHHEYSNVISHDTRDVRPLETAVATTKSQEGQTAAIMHTVQEKKVGLGLPSGSRYAYYSWARLKCDRAQPCETCVKRGLSLSCSYVHAGNGSERLDKSELKPRSYMEMQEKINQLETLVSTCPCENHLCFAHVSGV